MSAIIFVGIKDYVFGMSKNMDLGRNWNTIFFLVLLAIVARRNRKENKTTNKQKKSDGKNKVTRFYV